MSDNRMIDHRPYWNLRVFLVLDLRRSVDFVALQYINPMCLFMHCSKTLVFFKSWHETILFEFTKITIFIIGIKTQVLLNVH